MSNITTKKNKKLSIPEYVFCNEYLLLHGVKPAIKLAYKKAFPYCSDNTAKSNGWKLLKQERVKKYIEVGLNIIKKDLESKFEITKKKVLRDVAEIAFLDPREIFDENGKLIPLALLPPHITKSIHIVEVNSCGEIKYKFHDKMKAMELLARYLNLFEKEHKTRGSILGEILSEINNNPPKQLGPASKQLGLDIGNIEDHT